MKKLLFYLTTMMVCVCAADASTFTGKNLQEKVKPDSLIILGDTLKKNMTMSLRSTPSDLAPQLREVVHPSLSSQNFMRYGAHHPALSTGTVNVNIPLYDIKVGNFSLPVSISYATNGIKVNDSPYPIGFGWILHPALRITRSIRGRVDEYIGGRSIKTEHELNYMTTENQFLYKKAAIANEGLRGLDTEYDIFSVSLPNETFKFVLEPQGSGWRAVSVGTNAKITVRNQHAGVQLSRAFYFEIIDENGIKYFFGQIDSNNTTPYEESISAPYSQRGITTWGLTQIVLPGSQEDIKFKWNKINTLAGLIIDTGGGTATLNDLYDMNDFEYSLLGETEGLHNTWSEPNPRFIDIIQLSQIDFPTGKLNYSYITNSEAGNLLNKIEVIEKSTSNSIKTVLFTRDTGKEGVLLKKIDITGEGSYLFEYDLNRFEPTKACAQDYWGFYNNKPNGFTLTPRVSILKYGPLHIGGQSPSKSYTMVGSADRSIDDVYMQAYLLKKISYPTGGTTSFSYETHQFDGRKVETAGIRSDYLRPFTKGGGVRLKEMVNKASPTSPSEVITYKYGKNENGKGFAVAEPTLDTFMAEYAGYDEYKLPQGNGIRFVDQGYRILSVGEHSNYADFLLFDVPIWYDQVTEYKNGSKTSYYYEYGTKPSMSSVNRLYVGLLNGEYLNNIIKYKPAEFNVIGNPSLFQKIMYIKQGTLYKPKAKELYEYTGNSLRLNNVGVQQYLFRGASWNYSSSEFEWDTYRGSIKYSGSKRLPMNDPYKYATYNLYLANQLPKQIKSVEYIENDSIVELKIYNYGKKENNLILKDEIVSNSKQGTSARTYYYPWENLTATIAPTGFTASMLAQNRVATPVQITESNNGVFARKKSVQFNDFGNNLILPLKEYYQTAAGVEEMRIQYHQYDAYGNPIYVTMDDSIKVVYLWSHKGQYPVAEIKNATYSQVATAAKVVGLNLNTLSSTDTPTMRLVESLRSNSTLSRALVTVYTYKPLVGVTQISNPQGIITYYEYDAFGRLKQIYIMNGAYKEVIKSYEYNYKNN